MELENFNNSIPTIEYFNNRYNTPDWQIWSSRIDFIDLTYVTKGQAIYTVNRQKILVEEGDLLCIPKGSERAAHSEDSAGFECFATNFLIHSMTGEELEVPLPLLSQVGIHSDIISQYRRLNENYAVRRVGHTMRVRAQFMLILQRFMEILVYDVDTYQFDSRIKKAIRYITEHYADHLTISTVAAVVSLNPVYFGTLFKKETRVTFRDYLTTIRLNQAEDMLRAGKWNVTEVAQNCGFTDVFYFSRLFKKHRGIPPSAVQSQ